MLAMVGIHSAAPVFVQTKVGTYQRIWEENIDIFQRENSFWGIYKKRTGCIQREGLCATRILVRAECTQI